METVVNGEMLRAGTVEDLEQKVGELIGLGPRILPANPTPVDLLPFVGMKTKRLRKKFLQHAESYVNRGLLPGKICKEWQRVKFAPLGRCMAENLFSRLDVGKVLFIGEPVYVGKFPTDSVLVPCKSTQTPEE